MPPILRLPFIFHVHQLLNELKNHPELFGEIPLRTMASSSPHYGTKDIWVRFNNYLDVIESPSECCDEHQSVWYHNVVKKIPSVRALVIEMAHAVGVYDQKDMGGVLITKIPPGGQVKPHVDNGWHANHYDKFAIQLKGNKDQSFNFEGYSLSPQAGETFWFNNQHLHWVTNDSNEDRITLIVCLKTDIVRKAYAIRSSSSSCGSSS